MAGIASILHKPRATTVQKWLDAFWVILLLIAVGYSITLFQAGRLCAFYGTDFRGYYAAAQIARQRGFAQIYDPQTQYAYQEPLSTRCPGGKPEAPLLQVVMPYLPVYMVIFLPLTFLDYTTAFYGWVVLNLALLLVYLVWFTRALGEQASMVRLLQWGLCVPVFSNLFLGQINILLMVCLGEFVLAYANQRRWAGGFWLGWMMMKPHLLILLLPGLVVRRNWGVLLGFSASGLVVVLASVLLAGWVGVWEAIGLAAQFSGPLIQTGPTMMNFRALAYHLALILPAPLAWTATMCGAVLAAGYAISRWRRPGPEADAAWLILVTATLAATFAINWHSHFYLLTLLVPLLLALDLKGILPAAGRWAWLAGPPIYFGLLMLALPEQARNGFGLGMLALNLVILAWGGTKLSHGYGQH